MRRGTKRKAYASQCEASCGEMLEQACGPISLYNSLMIHGIDCTTSTIMADFKSVQVGRGPGMSPEQLLAFALRTCPNASLVHPAKNSDLVPGAIIYVNSTELLLSCAKPSAAVASEEKKPDEQWDSHIVTVESTSSIGVVVINPDARRCGRGFKYDLWGRMTIPWNQLDAVWQSTRHDKTATKRALVYTQKRTAQ